MACCSTPPNYLTPECSGNVTQVSLDDSSHIDTLSDSMKSDSLKCSISSSPLQRCLRLALPSPHYSDLDESMRSFGDDANSSPDCLLLSHSLPSPKDSDADEPVCSDTGNSFSSSSELTSGASITGTELISQNICN